MIFAVLCFVVGICANAIASCSPRTRNGLD